MRGLRWFAGGGMALAAAVVPGGAEEVRVPYPCEETAIEVLFAPGAGVRLREGRPLCTAGPRAGREPDRLADALRGLNHSWRRACDAVAEDSLDALHRQGEQRSGRALYNLNGLHRLRIPRGRDVWALCDALEALPDVLLARPVPIPTPLPVPPDFGAQQGYLAPAGGTPAGLDVGYAWTRPGGNGNGVTVCDMEYGWNYTHADVTKALNSQILTNSGIPYVYGFTDVEKEHGIAVVGIMVADANGWGTTGICHGASLKTCGTFYGTPTQSWNVPGALAAATAVLRAGDVIVLEQQWSYGGSFIPIEWWLNYSPSTQSFNGVYAAIQTAVANGIHVVEVAGNSGYNLDMLQWYGDSGAVVVGAGGVYTGGLWPEGDLQRISFSTYGTRVDLQGWGEDVYTTGYGSHYSAEGSNYYYRATFDGTSSAAPVVAGAIACLEGYWQASFGTNCPPWLARRILRTTGTAQVTPPAGNIGPRPNLRAAFAADSDGDLMPDGWEYPRGLDATNALDAALDPDGDGRTSGEEYAADTHPNQSGSVLRIEAITNLASGFRITWQGGVLATQYLERCDAASPAAPPWTVLFTNRPPTATSTNLTDPAATNRTHYYRIRAGR